MADEKKSGWALLPSWDNVGPGWGQVFGEASIQLRLRQEIASVEASWFAVENPDQVESEARRRLIEKLQKGQ